LNLVFTLSMNQIVEEADEEGMSVVALLSFLICKSVEFDTVVLGKNSIQKLSMTGDAMCFVLVFGGKKPQDIEKDVHNIKKFVSND